MSTSEHPPMTTDPSRHHRHHRTPIVFPTLLIVGGILLLASNLGYLSWGFWGSIARLWPLILVLIGIEIIFAGRGGWSTVGSAIAVVVVVAFVIMFGFVIAPQMGWNETNWGWPQASIQGLDVIQSPGNVVSEDLNLRDFQSVEIAGPFKVEIVQSDSYSTILTVDDNLRDNVEVEVVDQEKKLRLGIHNAVTFGNTTLNLKIAMPELTQLKTSGACNTTLSGIKSPNDLNVLISAASSLKGDAQVHNFAIETSGASQIEMTGSANDVQINASGASHLNMTEFTATTANVKMSGACGADLAVSEKLDAELSGASWLSYYGNPTLGRNQVSGGSGLRHK